MKKILIGALAIIIASSLTTILLYDYLMVGDSFPKNFIKKKIHSNILNEDRELIIHLPANYDSIAKYPVMYVLDGGSLDNHISNKFDVLSQAGYVPQAIVIGIPNMTAENRQRNLTPPFMRQDNEKEDSSFGEADSFLSFLESELFPFVEMNYNTSSKRLITGNSRGGLLVMYSLIAKPDLFQARFCYSAPLWRQNDTLTTRVTDFLITSDTLNSFLYMSAGENETENIKGGLEHLAKALEQKVPVGLIWHADYTPHAIHQNNAEHSAAIGIRKWSEYLNQTQFK